MRKCVLKWSRQIVTVCWTYCYSVWSDKSNIFKNSSLSCGFSVLRVHPEDSNLGRSSWWQLLWWWGLLGGETLFLPLDGVLARLSEKKNVSLILKSHDWWTHLMGSGSWRWRDDSSCFRVQQPHDSQAPRHVSQVHSSSNAFF